jgi:hypothetical protein
VKERPILFSAPMVRAILFGEKTQTRRVVTLPKWIAKRGGDLNAPSTFRDPGFGDGEYLHVAIDEADPGLKTVHRVRCPYGEPGDRLWVKETHQYADWTEDGMPWIRYAADYAERFHDSGSIPEAWGEKLTDIWEGLSAAENVAIDGKARDRAWRPSIHMPRWASRFTLEITSVRVERLETISHRDALAEGVRVWERWEAERAGSVEVNSHDPRDAYAELWESINGVGSWALNPWVWVVEFAQVQP